MVPDTTLMTELMGRLRNSMNGAVTGSMQERGIGYGLNYGVAVHTIRDIARDFAPNHSLALLLYKQQIRELKIAATYVADPETVNLSELAFWAGGLETPEIAEHVGRMIGGSGVGWQAVKLWSESGNSLSLYASLLASVKKLTDDPTSLPGIETIVGLCNVAVAAPDRFVWRATVSLLERADRLRPDLHDDIERLDAYLSFNPADSAKYISSEFNGLIG